MKQIIKRVKGGKIDVTLLCDCGKPIVLSNKWGMFCEDKCGLGKAKEAHNLLSKFIGLIK